VTELWSITLGFSTYCWGKDRASVLNRKKGHKALDYHFKEASLT